LRRCREKAAAASIRSSLRPCFKSTILCHKFFACYILVL
jgi:hypothetical protein